MSESVADNQLRSFFERWNRLEEEKRTISDDLKDLFAEMKGCGFDTKAARAVFREQVGDKAAAEEFDAICDLYRASLNGPRARPAHAPARVRENIEEFRHQTASETRSDGDPSPTSGERDLVEAGTGQNSAVLPQEPCTAPIRKPLRPHCQRPDQCGGYGAKHCYSCAKAAEVEAA